MRKILGFALISSALLAASGALAADIPMKAPVAAPVMAPVAYSWTGFYIGAHAGYNWGRSRAVDVDGYNTVVGDAWDFRTKGFVGGGQLGYNLQSGPLVFGIEADLGYLNAKGSAASPASCRFAACDTVGSLDSDFYATARGRLGLAWGQWMIYGTGGYFGLNTKTSVLDTCFAAPCFPGITNAADSSFRHGWTAGGGIEVTLGSGWSIKGEYLYYDVGSKTLSAPLFFPPVAAPFATFRWDTRSDGNIVRLGINYRFGDGPVVARY